MYRKDLKGIRLSKVNSPLWKANIKKDSHYKDIKTKVQLISPRPIIKAKE